MYSPINRQKCLFILPGLPRTIKLSEFFSSLTIVAFCFIKNNLVATQKDVLNFLNFLNDLPCMSSKNRFLYFVFHFGDILQYLGLYLFSLLQTAVLQSFAVLGDLLLCSFWGPPQFVQFSAWGCFSVFVCCCLLAARTQMFPSRINREGSCCCCHADEVCDVCVRLCAISRMVMWMWSGI